MRSYAVTLSHRRWLSERTFELTFNRPPDFEYLPGQRIRIDCGGVQRDYSLLSIPPDPELAICARHVPHGALTPVLAGLACGSAVTVSGPYGYFSRRVSPRPSVFVATGTGIAPFVAFVRSGARPHLLIHGVRDATELYYRSVFLSALASYVPCLTNPPLPTGSKPTFFQGRVTAYLAQNLAQDAYDFYLCGRMDMIREVTLLVDRRFPGSHVYSEIFF